MYLLLLEGLFFWSMHASTNQWKLTSHSDSTASTLTNLFYELASSPDITRMLQSEIDSIAEPTYQELSHMRLLNAAIDETLRLHPPVPSGMQRVTPSKGLSIDDVYIPGDCLVQMPLYSIFRGMFLASLNAFIYHSAKTYPRLGVLWWNSNSNITQMNVVLYNRTSLSHSDGWIGRILSGTLLPICLSALVSWFRRPDT